MIDTPRRTFTFVAVLSFIIDFQRPVFAAIDASMAIRFRRCRQPPWLMPLPPPAGRHAITLRHYAAAAIDVSMIRFHACRHFRHFAGIFAPRAAALFFHYFNYFLADAITAIYLPRQPAIRSYAFSPRFPMFSFSLFGCQRFCRRR
jgi:hypothetical protein